MGSSTVSRGGPGYQGENTNRGAEKYSTGAKKCYEGTLISGESSGVRKGGGNDTSRTIKGPKY